MSTGEPLVAQIEEILGRIERMPHDCDSGCWPQRGGDICGRWHSEACEKRQPARVRTEIARTVERMGAYLIHEGREGNSDKAWAASLQAARPEETKP